MNNLHRELAPLSDAAWADLEDEVKQTFRRHIAGRRFVEMPEPRGYEFSSLTTGRVKETGTDVETWTEVYAGPCRFPRADAGGRVVVTGETITPASPTVKVPWHVEGVRPDDRVTCTASISPGMVGRVLWVTDTSPRTFQSAVNLTCREVR